MELSKSELLKKLETISNLFNRATVLYAKMKNFVPEDNYQRKVEVPEFPIKVNNVHDKKAVDILINDVDHTADNAVEHMSKCYDTAFCPKKPAEPVIKDFKKPPREKQDSLRKKCRIAAIISIIFAFFEFVYVVQPPHSISIGYLVIALIAAGVFVFFKKKFNAEKADADKIEEEALAQYNAKKEATLKEYEEKLKDYESQTATYKTKHQEFLIKYKEWRKIYIESVAEEEKIAEKLENDRQEGIAKIENEELLPVLEELSNVNDLVSKDYLTSIDDITDLIRSGRADNIKEAINLYEDILYKERKLQLEREKEEQRQREEELRRQDEERRYQEDMQFRQQQERQRQKEAAESMNLQKQQHEENMKFQRQQQEQQERERTKQLREQREKERELQNAASQQCRACANVGHCNMSIHNKTPNCTGFRPR